MKRLIAVTTALLIGAVLAFATSPDEWSEDRRSDFSFNYAASQYAASQMKLDLTNLQPIVWDAKSQSAIAVDGFQWDTIDVVTTSGDTVQALLLVAKR